MKALARMLPVTAVALLLGSAAGVAAVQPLQRISAERYVAEAKQGLVRSLRLSAIELEVEPSRRYQDIDVRDGNLELKGRAPAKVSNRTVVWVDVLVNARIVKRIPVALTVHCWAEALVTVTPLNGRTPVAPQGVVLKRVDVAGAMNDFIDSIDTTYGMRLRHDVGREHVLTQRDLEPRPAIERGAAVELSVIVGGVRVQRAGIAESEGYSGQAIRVRIAQSGERLRAIVTGNNKAVVSSNG